MTPTRRQMLAALGAAAGLAVAPPLRAATTAGRLRDLLDRAAVLRVSDPAAALALLRPVDDATLSIGDRLDLSAARAGLAVDAQIARDVPAASASGNVFATTPRGGAWKAAVEPAAIEAETAAILAKNRAGVALPAAWRDTLIAAIAGRQRRSGDAIAAALARERAALREAPTPKGPGLAHLPDGRTWYALLLRRSTGDDVTPEGAERRLVAERDVLVDRADAVFARVGLPSGTIGARYRTLWQDPTFLYTDTPAGRAAAVDDMARVLADILAHLPPAIAAGVPGLSAVGIASLTPADLAADRGGYRMLPSPASPGAYVVDLRDIARRPRWTLPSVVAHETLPGHLLQLPFEAVARPHPLRRDYAAGFAEGWATYAEGWASACGWLGDNPRVMLGHLHWLLFRVGRAIADIRLHWHGEPLATVRADFERIQGVAAYFAPFDTEFERIALEPATRAADAVMWFAIEDAITGGSRVADLLRHGRRRTEGMRLGTT